MYRIFMALAFASAVSACSSSSGGDGSSILNTGAGGTGTGAQPLIPEPTPDPQPDPVASPDKFADDGDSLRMNDIDFDPATGELILNNMSFDDKNPYALQPVATAGLRAAGSTYDVYRSVAGPDEYYAVFRLSDNGYAQVAAAGSRSTVFSRPFDIGGAGAERLSGDGSLPAVDATYVFTGEYAAVRTLYPDSRDTQEEIQYVTGVSQLTVDIEDFDYEGSARGLILDRKVFSDAGVEIDGLRDTTFIRLDPTSIDFDNWSIDMGDAQLVPLAGTSGSIDGSWSGLFAGPNGEEVAGIVVVEGQTPIGVDPVTGDFIEVNVREAGTFVGTR